MTKPHTTVQRHGNLQYLLYKVDAESGNITRKVYAYYHPTGTVTFELMPAAPNHYDPWQALLRTTRAGKLHLLWVDLDRNPTEQTIRQCCRRFLKSIQP